MPVFHEHHIVPTHAGGSDDPSNKVRLTIEEHAETHRKRYEELGDEYDRIAWQMLSGQMKVAEAIKEAQRESGRRTKGRRWADSGKSQSEEFKQFMSEFKKIDMLGNQNAVGHVVSDEVRKSIAKNLRGNTNKLGKTGYKLSEEFKRNAALRWTGDKNPAPGLIQQPRQNYRRPASNRRSRPVLLPVIAAVF